MAQQKWIAVAVSAAAMFACAPAPPADGGADTGATTDIGTGTDAASDVTNTDAVTMGDAMVCVSPDAGVDGLPNLRAELSQSQITVNSFGSGSCEWDERCIDAPGTRRLLRFTLTTPNDGPADLHLGSPTAPNRPAGQFEFSTCHNHWHLLGYAEYVLENMAGNVIARGHKQSFCLEDFGPRAGMPGAFTCNDQGIHAHAFDTYDRALPCQWIDITDVPAGHYRIVARINTHCVIPETDYTDDRGELEVDIPALPDGGIPVGDPLAACTGGETGPGRDCGWRVEGAPMTCTAGTMVTVGCGMGTPACTMNSHGGACTGDPVMRICAGNGACTAGIELASNDDHCGGVNGSDRDVCPGVTFTCPATGQYTILTGAYAAGQAYTCVAGP